MPAIRKKERIYIVPHWTGLVLAATSILVLLAGAVLAVSADGYQVLVAALIALGLVVLLQTNENLRGIKIDQVECEPVEHGAQPVLLIHVCNMGKNDRIALRARVWKKWKTPTMPAANIPVLAAGDSITVRLPLEPSCRGIHPIPTLVISSIFPAGLCCGWKTFSQTGEIVVYPRAAGRDIESHAIPGSGEAEFGGETGDDVIGHRPYQAWDAPSRLDWKIFAKRGKLAVRERGSTADQGRLIRWADTSFLSDGEIRLEQLSYWLEACNRQGIPFLLELGEGSEITRWSDLRQARRGLAAFSIPPRHLQNSSLKAERQDTL